MDRNGRIKAMFDTSGFGLEIGPSYNPLLRKAHGYNVETVDYVDAAFLRTKYANDPTVDISEIEEINYVSDGSSLLDIVETRAVYDFVYASHVVEHVPDFVSFISDCSSLIKDAGSVVLAVPDKRFCFDVYRPVSTAGDVLQAFLEKRTRHPAGMLFDHISLVSLRDGAGVWVEPNLDGTAMWFTVEDAKQLFEYAPNSREYHDIHAWQFTPASFQYLIKTLRRIGYLDLGVKSIETNPPGIGAHEFYCVLSRNAKIDTTTDIDLLKAIEQDLRAISLQSPLER